MAFATNILTNNLVLNTYYNGGISGVDNRHGNIRGAGTVSDSGNFSSSTFGEGNEVITIVSGVGGVDGTNGEYGASSFNYGVQVINYYQTSIAGAANTTLQGGQSNSANEAYTPLQIDVLRTYFYKTAVVAGNWNEFNGTFSSVSSSVSGAWDIAASADDAAGIRTAGTDIAANTTQNIPGRMTYRDGSATPIQSGYGARHLW